MMNASAHTSPPSKPGLARRESPFRPGGAAAGPTPTTKGWLRRLATRAGVAFVILYVLGVTAGYVWLHYSRGLADIGVIQVALLRTAEIRRSLAAQQFARAKTEWEAKNFQAAYVYFNSAVRRDPDNITGRLAAAQFLGSLGATNLEVNLLEEGLARAPDNRPLNQTLFALLLSTGRTRKVLELLHGKYAQGLTGANAPLLQTAELQATLAASGGPAALGVLNRHPELRKDPLAVPIVARVLWAAGEKTQAIELQSAHIQAQPDDYGGYAQLADWQFQTGRLKESVGIALQACQRFPQEPAPRVLLLEIGSAKLLGSSAWPREIAIYLRDFAGRPDAIVRLAELAGRRGWPDLALSLYTIGSAHREDLGRLALCYSDALAAQSQVEAARAVLAQVELQAPESNSGFFLQLRQRQVLLAAAAGKPENVREYSRRLAALVRSDSDALEQYRQYYVKLGLPDAAAQFADATPKQKVAVK